MTYEQKNIIYNYHKEISEKIENERVFQQHNFDSWLLKLCAGSFAVSFAFIEKLINFNTAQCKYVLICSWLCFALCLIFSIFGFLNSERLFRFGYIQEWNEYKNETENANIKIKKSHRFFIARFLNIFNFLLFTGGVLCLVFFVAKNL